MDLCSVVAWKWNVIESNHDLLITSLNACNMSPLCHKIHQHFASMSFWDGLDCLKMWHFQLNMPANQLKDWFAFIQSFSFCMLVFFLLHTCIFSIAFCTVRVIVCICVWLYILHIVLFYRVIINEMRKYLVYVLLLFRNVAESYLIVICCYLRTVGRSPPESKEYIDNIKEISDMKPSKAVNVTHSSSTTSSATATLSERRLDNNGRGCRRKHTRKSRIYVKSEPSPELSSVAKTTHRHYHQLPTPDTSPIRLLPFSPSQVAHRLSVLKLSYVSVGMGPWLGLTGLSLSVCLFVCLSAA